MNKIIHRTNRCNLSLFQLGLQLLDHLLDEEMATARDRLLALTNDAGIMTRPAWTLMHRLPMFSGCPRMDLSIAESLERRIINIPSSAELAG